MLDRFAGRRLLLPLAAALPLPTLALPALAQPRAGLRWRGLNLVQLAAHPLGGPNARLAMRQTLALGADSIALVPFLWQASASATEVSLGGDMTADQLRAGIAQARALGLRVLVKPHLWVQGGQPGVAQPRDEAGWRRWFASYGSWLLQLARLAQEAGAEALSLGSGLTASLGRPEWRQLAAQARAAFRGRLVQVAESPEAAEQAQHWEALDGIGLRLYPALGRDDGPNDWLPVMQREAERLDRLAARWRRRVWVAELGLRSAAGAAARPWEAVEDRVSVPDQRVQAMVLARWLAVLDRPSVEATLLWRWFTDPQRGGPQDTDFTLQNKLAEGVLLGAWAPR
jgi:hypothetical protein